MVFASSLSTAFTKYRNPQPLIADDIEDSSGSRAFVSSMTYKRKKYHVGDTHLKKGWRTKRRTKDLDQIDQDLQPENAEKLLKQDVDYEKPGLAQFYCVHCAKHFIDGGAFNDHIKSKPHKRRMKALETEPYTIEESERAAGMGSYVQPKKRKIDTMLPESVKNEESVEDIKKRAKLSNCCKKEEEKEEKSTN